MPRSLAAPAVALLVVGPACKGLAPPSNLQVTSPAFDLLVVRWTPPPDAVDGFELDARIDSPPAEQVFSLPGNAVGGSADLSGLSEMLLLRIRVRSVRGGGRSAWTPEVTYLRGVRPPPKLTATLVDGISVDLAWSNASLVANQLVLERADADQYGATTGPWSALMASFGATTYHDGSPHEIVYQAYRVRYGKDDTWSTDALGLTGPVAVFPPAGLAALPVAGGVRLAWTNRSLVATKLSVRRWPDGTAGIALLPPDASGFLDSASSPFPSSTYAVVASDASVPPHDSRALWSGLPAFQVNGPEGPLGASTAPLPDTFAFRRSGDGRWVHVGTTNSGALTVVRETADGIEQHAISSHSLVGPYLALDGAGRPHVLGYTLPVYPDPLVLVHEWVGASSWSSETIPPPEGFGSTTQYGVDGAGNLMILNDPTFCTGDTGAWRCGSVPQPAGWSAGFGRLLVARDGTAFVVSTKPNGSRTDIAIATRPPGGTWTVEIAPLDCGYNPEPRILPDARGDLGLVCHKNNVANPPGELDVYYAERRSNSWSALEAVGARTSFSLIEAAAAPQLARVHVLTSPGGVPPVGLELWSRTAQGWRGSSLARTGTNGQLIGYLDAGKLWAVAKPLDYSFPVPDRPFAMWQEQ